MRQNNSRVDQSPNPAHPQPTPERIAELGEKLGFPFRQNALLVEACTHRSYVNDNLRLQADLKSYERLEFLGDAILEFLAADWLYQRFPTKPEGELTLIRMQLIRTETLGILAKALGIHHYLRLGNGEEAIGARQSPRILGNLFESVLGAIYLDQGLEAARDFALGQLKPALEELMNADSTKDPKSRFQEWSQAQATNITPTYEVIYVAGPDHEREYVVETRLGDEPVGWGNGKTIRVAAHAAAEWALYWLGTETQAQKKDSQ